MKNSNTSERLKYYMEKSNLKQVDILSRVEKSGGSMSKSALSQYISGASEPKQDKLTMLSKALGVSETWLMGYGNTEDRPSETEIEDNKKDDHFSVIAAHFDGEMTDEEFEEINQFIEYVKSKRK